jgi:7-carboxy-7-deazaguanine synthase
MISMDLKTPSSTMQQHTLFENIKELRQKDQLKCIIKNKKDFVYAKQIITEYKPRCPIIFQPVWGVHPKKIAHWILKENLPVRLGLQMHKIIWGGETQK